MLWKGFQKPKRLECDLEALSNNYGKFYAQPFERGFGTTIGNSLRRFLLSSVEGAAITSVKIDGVLHEFSSLPGVVEDITDVILNLKMIPIKIHSDHPEIATIKAEGVREIKSGDIEASSNVEIIDPNIHIATLTEEGKLHMEMRIRKGRGYIPADQNYEEDIDVSFIPIDSVHSPVKKVNFTVEDARLGQATDYDKLIIEVWTNGTLLPQDAIALAAKLLKDHMIIFINFEEEPEQEEEEISDELEKMQENLSRSVEELELSVRASNCLKNAGIKTIGELVQKSESEMLKTKNFGRKSLNEIKEMLSGMGLSLGMTVDERALKVRSQA